VQVVGSENVTLVREPDQFSKEDYMDSSKSHNVFRILEKEYFLAFAVVSPRHIPDVQDMMRLANDLRYPHGHSPRAEILDMAALLRVSVV
jgi:hypothetical protein